MDADGVSSAGVHAFDEVWISALSALRPIWKVPALVCGRAKADDCLRQERLKAIPVNSRPSTAAG
jgi:hypothetical protein